MLPPRTNRDLSLQNDAVILRQSRRISCGLQKLYSQTQDILLRSCICTQVILPYGSCGICDAFIKAGGRRDPPLQQDNKDIAVGAGFHARPWDIRECPLQDDIVGATIGRPPCFVAFDKTKAILTDGFYYLISRSGCRLLGRASFCYSSLLCKQQRVGCEL